MDLPLPFWPYLRLEQKRKQSASAREDLQQFLSGDGHGFLRTEGPHLAGYQISGTKKPLKAAQAISMSRSNSYTQPSHPLAHHPCNQLDLCIRKRYRIDGHSRDIDQAAVSNVMAANVEWLVV